MTQVAPQRDARRIVIAGASSLLGTELGALLGESRFAGGDLRLVDEPVAAGTLTAAAGEPVVIQAVEEGSFERAGYIFFTGTRKFFQANAEAAMRTGAKIIDLSGALVERNAAVPWFPKLDWLRSREFAKDERAFAIPSALATAAAALALGLSRAGLRRIMVTGFQPVSEAGAAGIEELESQTGQLLSFQGVGQPVFDTQVAFNMADRFGPGSTHTLDEIRERVRRETQACVEGKCAMPAVQVLHAPVFYGMAFSATGVFDPGTGAEQIVKACEDAGLVISGEGDTGASNVGVAGEKEIRLSQPRQDAANLETWWFWGAADNMRVPAASAVKLAEMLY